MATANGDCVACNERKGKQYSLLLHGREGNRDINPTLCGVCADEYLTLDWVERRVASGQD
jgi:hypothetical protein